ncbi:MAG: phosphoadenosine phosphosulfate reductase family protein [Lachnospiraceae bacterium]|nr:phosphoadenosine phosphosulfate reductase family protein [Lachnospiraceae bacterium]
MIKYRCSLHNITFQASECPICHKRGELETSEIYWCDTCRVPLYEQKCSLCGSQAKRLAGDLRPVFPQERLLVEIILGKPFEYQDSSVWNGMGNRYFADGKKINFSIAALKNADIDNIFRQYKELESRNSDKTFCLIIKKWCQANRSRFQEISSEAMDYVREKAQDYKLSEMFVSFSGGKDSTVVSDIVQKSLGDKKVLHIFGDTTLEFPDTYRYVSRFKKEHQGIPLVTVKNKEKNFEDLCTILGPPSRVMRWCCTVFKTGAISRKIDVLFKGKKSILTFYGIRRNESASRSKYDRESDSPKIAVQRTVSPIIDWMDYDVWLYILSSGIDFNDAYRLGYVRVGCWCCPNNSGWSEFLSQIHMKEQYQRFRDILIEFAKKVGKTDPEVYVDEGKWKARQGGNGLEYARKSLVDFKPCALEEDTFNYELQIPISEELYELFKPFGELNRDLGNKRLNEIYILNHAGQLQIKLQGRIGSTLLKVSILNKRLSGARGLREAEEKIRCQITKYQMCMGCNACEAICRHGAISIKEKKKKKVLYQIDDKQCVRCGACINHFNGGCYMRKVLTIKRQ